MTDNYEVYTPNLGEVITSSQDAVKLVESVGHVALDEPKSLQEKADGFINRCSEGWEELKEDCIS